MSLGSGVQTIHPGLAGPVSYSLDGVILTGCFFELKIFIILLASHRSVHKPHISHESRFINPV